MILSVFSSHTPLIRSNWHWQRQCPCKRSRSEVKVTEVKTNFGPIWTCLYRNSSLNSHMATKWWHRKCALLFLAATKQLYEWFCLSVCLFVSVCPSGRTYVLTSVRHTFLTMFPSSYHHEIFRSYYQWRKWHPCKKSRSEVKGPGHRGQHPT